MPEALRVRQLTLFRELGLAPGDEIPTEAELMTTLGASRQAVRETLMGLEALGLVVSRQGARRRMGAVSLPAILRGAVSSVAVDLDSLRDLLEVRRVLEAAFFPIAAAAYDAQKLATLRALTDRMEAKARRGETSHEEDALFHHALYEGLGNEILLGLIEAFWEVFHATSPTPSGVDVLLGTALGHSRIVDALETREIPLAAHMLNIHFFEIRARLKKSSITTPNTPNTQRRTRQ